MMSSFARDNEDDEDDEEMSSSRIVAACAAAAAGDDDDSDEDDDLIIDDDDDQETSSDSSSSGSGSSNDEDDNEGEGEDEDDDSNDDDQETSSDDDDDDDESATSNSGAAVLKKPPSLSTLAQAAAQLSRRPSSGGGLAAGGTSSGAGSDGGVYAAGAATTNTTTAPKVRVKLSMRKLPTLANRKPGLPHKKRKKDGAVKATIVDSGDEVDAVAAVVARATSSSTRRKSSKPKRRSANPTKALRMPLIASPGLFMVPPSSSSAGSAAAAAADSSKDSSKHGKVGGYVTPSSVFDNAMRHAGYTLQNRTERPHRGSSVKRSVGDMFDSNYALSLRFPRTVPPRLLPQPEGSAAITGGASEDGEVKANKEDGSSITSKPESTAKRKEPLSLPQLLIQSLNSDNKKGPNNGNLYQHNNPRNKKKRKRPWQVYDMAPVSLTVPYPEGYAGKLAQYARDVEERERAIVAYQDAKEEAEIAQENFDSSSNDANNQKPMLSMVPPIPEPPEPPRIRDLVAQEQQQSHDAPELENSSGDNPYGVDKFEDDRHPLYPPRGKDNFVAHLDPDCFHITEGRYFGLYSNTIADPNFVGPNAPGLSGVHASGGSGLATSTSGGGISGAMALALSTTYNGTTAGCLAALRSAAGSTTSSVPGAGEATTEIGNCNNTSSVPNNSMNINGSTNEAPAKSTEPGIKTTPTGSTHLGPRPTATAADLKRLMDGDDQDLKTAMRNCIIRVAVHGSRSGRHGQSFRAPNGVVYPGASRAFSVHGGIKPCERCKSNKQGAYHCRLRRRHKQPDYDGGDSPGLLAPLLTAPMESLLC